MAASLTCLCCPAGQLAPQRLDLSVDPAQVEGVDAEFVCHVEHLADVVGVVGAHDQRQRHAHVEDPVHLVVVDLAKLLPGDAKAPEWARYQTALLMQLGDVVKHWCNRQGPDGRFTDNWGDDAELAVQWPFYTLITGDRDSAMAMQYAADHYWNDPRIKNGYVTWPMDALHRFWSLTGATPISLVASARGA